MTTVVTVTFGSHLYGTNTPSSDTDFVGVHIPNADNIIMQKAENTLTFDHREKKEGERNTVEDVDNKSYSLHYFFELITKGETIAIDTLFAPDQNLTFTSPLWEEIRANKHRLISKRSTAFVGYCRGQANKYGIKGSRVASAEMVSKFFGSAVNAYGATVKVQDVAYMLDAISDEHASVVTGKVSGDGTIGQFFECCDKKVSFTSSIKQAYEIFSRVYEGYGDRARKAQSNEGIDWKALSHAVRVGYEALELLSTGHVTFPLKDAAHVLNIKQGNLPYALVAEEIERLLDEVNAAHLVSTLPEKPDHKYIDDLILNTYKKELCK